MPPAAPKLQVLAEFVDFSAGEFGDVGGSSAPPKSFTGKNVVRYRDGGVGPRAGLRDLAPTGLVNGVVYGIFWPRSAENKLTFIQGDTVRRFDASAVGQAVSDYAGTVLAAVPSFPVDSTYVDNVVYITNWGDKCYKVDPGAGTVTALAGSPGGRAIASYGDRMLVGSQSGLLNRLRISAAADYTSWPASNFIDIGADTQNAIRGLYPVRDYLVIVMADSSIFLMTGVPTVNENTRRISSFPETGAVNRAQQPQRAAIDNTGTRVWLVDQAVASPTQFAGARPQHAAALRFADSADATDENPPPFGVTALVEADEIAMFGNARGLIRREGTWTKHEFDQAITGHAIGVNNGQVILCDGGAAGTPPKFWLLNTADDKPPIKNGGQGNLTSVGDGDDTAPACEFTTPEHWVGDKDAGDAWARYVIVDFVSYATGVSETNHFDLTLNALGSYERVEQPIESQVGEFDEAASESSVGGTRRSKQFSFGNQGRGRGFSLSFANMRGVKIKRAVVLGTVSSPRQM